MICVNRLLEQFTVRTVEQFVLQRINFHSSINFAIL